MSRLDDYVAAVWPDRWTVLARRLQPYCVAHAMLLQRLGLGAPAGRAELALAVEICRRDPPAATRWVQAGRARWQTWWALLRHAGRRGAWWTAQREKFHRYLTTADREPHYTITRAGRMMGTPRLLSVRLTLLRLGYAPDEVARMPIGRANWEYLAWWESQGALEIQNLIDDALDAAVKAELEAAPHA